MRQIARAGLTVLLAAGVASSASDQEVLCLSLREAQARAGEGNRLLEVARQAVLVAEGARLQAWSASLPSASLSEQALRTNDPLAAFGMRLGQERVSAASFAPASLNHPRAIGNFRTALEVRQPVFSGGGALYGRRQARAQVQAAGQHLDRSQQDVRLAVARAYWGLVLARQSLEAVRQSLEAARAHEEAARARYRNETVPLSDLLAAQVRVAELRGQELAAADGVAGAADDLTLGLGLDPEQVVEPADTLAERPLDQDLETLVQAALEQRPDLRAAALRAEAARHGVRAARAGYVPRLDAFAQAQLSSSEVLERQGESWTVGATLTWDLFTGLHREGTVRQAQAQAGQARARQDYLRQEVVRQVAAAWRGVQTARAQVAIAGEAVRQAEERLRMSDLQYRQEVIPATDLLDAETELTQVRLHRLQALHDLNVGIARLEHAAGITQGGQP
ncbi:MAG: TolC family protein [Candidatus Latescibacterota bacterium]